MQALSLSESTSLHYFPGLSIWVLARHAALLASTGESTEVACGSWVARAGAWRTSVQPSSSSTESTAGALGPGLRLVPADSASGTGSGPGPGVGHRDSVTDLCSGRTRVHLEIKQETPFLVQIPGLRGRTLRCSCEPVRVGEAYDLLLRSDPLPKIVFNASGEG